MQLFILSAIVATARHICAKRFLNLQQVQDEIAHWPACTRRAERDRERLLRTYVMLGVAHQAILAYFTCSKKAMRSPPELL
ncbi:MAG: hypothetical protein MZW92_31560 [Comamonadaceae bacterium]|nr:hypothetical protein [Comamonadaceae bacterium]